MSVHCTCPSDGRIWSAPERLCFHATRRFCKISANELNQIWEVRRVHMNNIATKYKLHIGMYRGQPGVGDRHDHLHIIIPYPYLLLELARLWRNWQCTSHSFARAVLQTYFFDFKNVEMVVNHFVRDNVNNSFIVTRRVIFKAFIAS